MKTLTKTLTTALFALFLFTQQAKAQAIWDGTTASNWTGTGTEATPYLITTPQQLAGIAAAVKAGNDFQGQFIKLANDLYLSNPSDANENKPQWTPIGEIIYTFLGGHTYYTVDTVTFRGTFDGAGYSIYNAYYNQIPDLEDWNDFWFGGGTIDFSGWYKGFFGYIEGATIKNVNLVDLTMVGAATMGGLVCFNNGGTITNCSVTGMVGSMTKDASGEAGGIVGVNKNGGIIENCRSEAEIRGRISGGLVGQNEANCTIRNSHATGYVVGLTSAGGFVGTNQGHIEDCYAIGDVKQEYFQYGIFIDAGGFVGSNSGTITRCYATGDVVSDREGGAGFVGTNSGIVTDCYATGNVTGGRIGGFVGYNGYSHGLMHGHGYTAGTVINCFSTGNTVTTYSSLNPAGFIYGFGAISNTINCYYNSDTNLSRERTHGSDLRTTVQMQSQAFVDTLNMVAALFGTSTWQYRAGQYPIPTGIPATNLTDYLAGGDGSESNPWLITTKAHLENFSIYVDKGYNFDDKYVKLGANIALNPPQSEWGITPPTPWNPIGAAMVFYPVRDWQDFFSRPFLGTFDGGGYEISNLYIDNLNTQQGLFGYLQGATIKNLGVVDAWVRARDYAGILAGSDTNGPRLIIDGVETSGKPVTITQCWTSGRVESSISGANGYAGGLMGSNTVNNDLIVKNSYSTADVKANYRAFGFAGSIRENNYFAGTLTGTNGTVAGTAFLFPNNTFAPLINCFYDRQTTGISDSTRAFPRTTAYLQSKEFVNVLNYWVDINNEQGEEQYFYWQHNVGKYPTFTLIAPPHSVTYNSNGGSHVTTHSVLNASKIVPPPAPEKANNTFGGWYLDEALTTLFDFNTEITANRTLYAKWFQPIVPDISWFNQFANTFCLSTKEQLAGFALLVNGNPVANDFSGKTVKLCADILLNDTTEWQSWGTNNAFANQWTQIGTQRGSFPAYDHPFKGTFDGDGYTISGLYINVSGVNESDGSTRLGLFGYIGSGAEIKNLGVTASFVKGSWYIGGLVGYNNGGVISKCYSEANVNGTNGVGGLIGYSTGNASISNCYATGNVSGTSGVGGLLGQSSIGAQISTITNCYAAGKVSGSGGGLVGSGGTITNSYYDRQTTEQSDTRGIPKTTAEMKQKHTFIDWDFEAIWGRNNAINNGYPYLRWSVDGFIEDDEDLSATVTFVSNGGSSVPAQNVLIGLTAGNPASPQREAYEFAGWYSNPALTPASAFDFATSVITSDTTLYAGWRVVYENNIGSLHEISNWTQDNVTWSSANNGQLAFSRAGSSVVLPIFPEGNKVQMFLTTSIIRGTDLVLETSPDGDTFTRLSAFTGGAEITNATRQVANRTRYIKILQSTSNMRGILISAKVTWVVGNENAYADVTFNSNGGSAVASINNAIIGMTIIEPIAPTKADNDFGGWYSDEALTQEFDFNTAITAAMTLYAKWTVSVTGITLNKNATVLTVGDTEQLTATVLPSNATNQTITWLSSAPSVATVTNGFITAVSAGEATITATTVDGSKTATCVVTVNALVNAQTPTISAQPQSETVTAGSSASLSVTASVTDGGTLSYQWYSNTTNSNSGGTAVGTNSNTYAPPAATVGTMYYYVVITNTNNAVNGVTVATTTSNTAAVTVNALVNAQTPTISAQSQSETVTVGGSVILSVTANITDGGTLSHQWYSNTTNSNSGGTAVGTNSNTYAPPTATVGTMYYYVVITNTNNAVNGVTVATTTSNTATITVETATVLVTGVTLNKNTTSLTVGDTEQLTATVAPANAINQTVTWSSSDPSVATVTNGLITAVSAGEATITVTTTDGSFTAQCTVTIDLPIEDCDKIRTVRIRSFYSVDALAGVNGEKYLSDNNGTLQWADNANGNSLWYEIPVPDSNTDFYFKNVATGNYIYRDNARSMTACADWQWNSALLSTSNARTDFYKFRRVASNWAWGIHLVNVAEANFANVRNKGAFVLSAINTNHRSCSMPTWNTSVVMGIMPDGGNAFTAIRLDVVSTNVENPDCGEGTPTDINTPQAKSLQAWTHNGRLYVNGLTVGQAWSVYNVSGMIVYQNIADSEKADIPLFVRGVYFIQSGGKTVKIVY